MNIALIVAYSKDTRVIGDVQKLPWNLPEDLHYFKRKTEGKIVIMGRKTFESLPHNLPDRTVYVLTRDEDYNSEYENVSVFTSLNKCLMMAKLSSGQEEIMVAGGGEVYEMFLPMASKVYVTEVMAPYEGDTVFPDLPESEWVAIAGEGGHYDENLDLFYSRSTFVRRDSIRAFHLYL